VGVGGDPQVAEDDRENDFQPVTTDEHPVGHRVCMSMTAGRKTAPCVVYNEFDQLRGNMDHAVEGRTGLGNYRNQIVMINLKRTLKFEHGPCSSPIQRQIAEHSTNHGSSLCASIP
jgi:hypothetical protein